MATLKDVAQLAGVTVTTVSRMLNGRGNVSGKTRERIHQAMDALGYSPNEMARSLKAASSPFIGVIVPTVNTPFFASLVEEIEKAAFIRGYRILLCVTGMDEAKERDCYTMMLSSKVSGIIQCNQTARVEEYVRPGAPVVIIERVSGKDIPSIVSDNEHGGRLTAEHLIARGCRHLASLEAPLEEESDAARRAESFRAVALAHGLPEPVRVFFPVEKLFSLDFEEHIEALFRDHPEVDGIGTVDAVAARVVHWCLKRGIRVPEDVKVVGYDDSTFASICALPLTTIRQPIPEIGALAVDTVIRQAAGEIVPVRSVLPVQLIQRSTT